VDVERYNCLMPVMNTMLDKCEHMLNTNAHLPNLPLSDANPTFTDDFHSYLQSNEWKTFMKKQVRCILPSIAVYLVTGNLYCVLKLYTVIGTLR